MKYAMRNIVGTSIAYEIQALFRPAGGGGIKGQLTPVPAPAPAPAPAAAPAPAPAPSLKGPPP